MRRHPAFGALKGTFIIEPGWDLARPAMDPEEWMPSSRSSSPNTTSFTRTCSVRRARRRDESLRLARYLFCDVDRGRFADERRGNGCHELSSWRWARLYLADHRLGDRHAGVEGPVPI